MAATVVERGLAGSGGAVGVADERLPVPRVGRVDQPAVDAMPAGMERVWGVWATRALVLLCLFGMGLVLAQFAVVVS